jgi:ATP-binding cassette, subfamily B, bacterial
VTTRAAFDSSTVREGFRVIGRAIRTQPWPFAVAVAGSVVYAAMTVGSALVFGWVTENVVEPAFVPPREVPRGLVVTAALLISGVAIVRAVGVVTRKIGATYMQAKLEAIYRQRIARRYQDLPMSWHQRHPTGELLSRANSDVESAFWPIAPLPLSAGVVVMLFLSAGVFIWTDLVLAAVAFTIGPVMAVANWHYNRLMNAPIRRVQELRAEASGIAHESFDGALVVKTLGREGWETERFRSTAEELRSKLIEVGRLRALYNPFIEALPSIGVLLVLVVGTWRIALGEISSGQLVTLAFLFTLLAFPIRVIGFLLSEFPRSVVGWDRVAYILDAEESFAEGELASDGDGPASADLVEVTFAYEQDEDASVLRDLTFAVQRGTILALVGGTGAGKSTITSLLVRLTDPSAGLVSLDATDLRRLRRDAIARDVAVVFQESFLFAESVRDNITLGEEFSDEEIVAAAQLAQAHEFVMALPQGYENVIGERGATLSGGQRQRVALARALVRRPRLLILDDATSSVDPRVEAKILEGLRRADLPSTIIVVAYRKATISLADRIVFLERGRIRATGTHHDLVESDSAYARLLDAYEREEIT